MSGGITSAVARYLLGKEQMELERDQMDRGTFRERMLAEQARREWEAEKLLREAENVKAQWTIDNYKLAQDIEMEMLKQKQLAGEIALQKAREENALLQQAKQAAELEAQRVNEFTDKLATVKNQDELDMVSGEYIDLISRNPIAKEAFSLHSNRIMRAKKEADEQLEDQRRKELEEENRRTTIPEADKRRLDLLEKKMENLYRIKRESLEDNPQLDEEIKRLEDEHNSILQKYSLQLEYRTNVQEEPRKRSAVELFMEKAERFRNRR